TLAVAGVSTPGDLTLNAGGLTIGGSVTAGSGRTVTLTSSGPIFESGGGIITAGTLTGSTPSEVLLTQNNQVDFLGSWSSGSLGFSFTNAQALGTSGTVSSAGQIT